MSPGTRQRRARAAGGPGTTVTVSPSTADVAAERGQHPLGVVAAPGRLHARSPVRTPRARPGAPPTSPARSPPARRGGSGWSGRAPTIASGSRAPPRRPTTRAPIRASGSITRSIGRRRSDSSPVSTVANGWPARTPTRSRAVVPELPQSTTSPGSVEPLEPAALDHEVPGPLPRHLGAERRDGPQGRQAVLALEEALHLGEPVGERAEERGAVRDGLVARHGDRAGEASDRTRRRRSRELLPNLAGASELRLEGRPVAARHELAPPAEDRLVARERVEQRPAVRAEDVPPERLGATPRCASCREAAPREEAAASPSAADDQRVGRQVRQVADLRRPAGRGPRRTAPHRAPEPLPERGRRQDGATRACRRSASGARARPSKRSARRGLEARALGAGHRMPADEAHPARAGHARRRVDHAPLHAAGVGQDGAGREVRPRGANRGPAAPPPARTARPGSRPRRPPPGRCVPRSAAPASSAARTAASCRATTTTSPASLRARTPPGDRAADEARADDRQARPAGRAHERAAPFPSTVRSAFTSRRVLLGRPDRDPERLLEAEARHRPHDHAELEELLVDSRRIVELGQDEVGAARDVADAQGGERRRTGLRTPSRTASTRPLNVSLVARGRRAPRPGPACSR